MRGAKLEGEGLHQARQLGVFTLKSEGKAFLIGPTDGSLLVTADSQNISGLPLQKVHRNALFPTQGKLLANWSDSSQDTRFSNVITPWCFMVDRPLRGMYLVDYVKTHFMMRHPITLLLNAKHSTLGGLKL